MKTTFLSIEDIHLLCDELRKLFAYLYERRSVSDIAKRIKNPQVPGILSESIVAYLIKQGKLLPEFQNFQIKRGGKKCDLLLSDSDKVVTVESKATSEAGFQRLRKGDIAADFLIWIHFDTYFLTTEDMELEVFLIPQPGKYYEIEEEVFVGDIESTVGLALQKTTIRLSEIR
jgi:hypothetical protein